VDKCRGALYSKVLYIAEVEVFWMAVRAILCHGSHEDLPRKQDNWEQDVQKYSTFVNVKYGDSMIDTPKQGTWV